MQKDLIRDMVFLSKKFPGTQQVRLLMGHALFGAAIQYGTPLFWTISPSSRHSGLCIRLSRFLQNDPYVTEPNSKGYAFRPWIGCLCSAGSLFWKTPRSISLSGFDLVESGFVCVHRSGESALASLKVLRALSMYVRCSRTKLVYIFTAVTLKQLLRIHCVDEES